MKRAWSWVGCVVGVLVLYLVVAPWGVGLQTKAVVGGAGEWGVPREVFRPAGWVSFRVRPYYAYWRWCVRVTSGIEMPAWPVMRSLQELRDLGPDLRAF